MADTRKDPGILDSVNHLTDEHRGHVAHCASHGGHYAAYYAATKGVAAVILNDAGIGRERVGLSGALYLEKLGLPAATISSLSARIGDGRDGHANGVISSANALAIRAGVKIGMRCREALDLLARAGLQPAAAPPRRGRTPARGARRRRTWHQGHRHGLDFAGRSVRPWQCRRFRIARRPARRPARDSDQVPRTCGDLQRCWLGQGECRHFALARPGHARHRRRVRFELLGPHR